jgi:general secretion pathway protein K
LSLVAAFLTLETRGSASIARNAVDNAIVKAAADAGIWRAILELLATRGKDQNNIRRDGTVYTRKFANCLVRISIRDEADKIDLNMAPVPLLTSLLRSVGVDSIVTQSLANSIADFRDVDHFVHPSGAEEAEYRAANLACRPKNAPFQSVDEVQQVIGMSARIYERIAPQLTVYTMPGGVNKVGERLASIVHEAGLTTNYVANSSGQVFTLRAEAKASNAGTFVREAIVQITEDGGWRLPWILAWQQPVN